MATVTLSQDGTGTNYSLDAHNDPANNILPGTTIAIVGEITGSLKPPRSGESGSPIIYEPYDDTASFGGLLLADHIAPTDKDYITIQDLPFNGNKKRIRGIGLRAECKNTIIQRCTFVDYQTLAIQAAGNTGSSGGDYGQDLLIQDCTFTDIGVWDDSSAADINIVGFYRRVTCRRNKHYYITANRGVDGVTFSQNGADGTGHLVELNEFYGKPQEQYTDFKEVKPGGSGETVTTIQNNLFDGQGTSAVVSHLHYNTSHINYYANTIKDCASFLHFVAVGAGNDAMGYINVIANEVTNLTNLFMIENGELGELLGNNVYAFNTLKNIGTASDNRYSFDIRTATTIVNNDFIDLTYDKSPHQLFRFQETGTDIYAASTLDNNFYNHRLGDTGDEKLLIKYDPGPFSLTLTQIQDDLKELNGQQIDSLYDVATGYPSNSPAYSAGSPLTDYGWTGGDVKSIDGRYYYPKPDVGAYQHKVTYPTVSSPYQVTGFLKAFRKGSSVHAEYTPMEFDSYCVDSNGDFCVDADDRYCIDA